MTYLVTGDRGFVGSNLVSYLTARGYDTIGFDMLQDYPTVEVITDFMKSNNIERVYHLGARAFIPDNYGMSIGAIVNSNIVFTANLLMACKNADIDRLLYFSTSEVYGNAEKLPIDENTPTKPESTYAATKLAAENLVRTFRDETGMDMRVLRHFNIYGPRDTQPRIIPKLIRAAKKNIVLKLGSLDVTRDFSYVTDACIAAENVMEYEFCEDFVHGSETETSLKSLIDLVSELYNNKLVIESDSSLIRPREVRRLVADTTKYRNAFQKHKHVDLRTGLEYTMKWYDEHDWEWENGKGVK